MHTETREDKKILEKEDEYMWLIVIAFN